MKKPKDVKKIDKFDRPAYAGLTLARAAMRPGCLTMLGQPSRVASSLIYPDGRRVWDK